MTSGPDPARRVKEANIAYHSALAKIYDANQPHFRPENVAKVDRLLAKLAKQTGGESLLDLGCGTGFVIHIAKKHFKRVVGVDITLDMLKLVDVAGGNVEVVEADTSKLPFGDGEFDVCAAYGFLHHLYDLRPTLSEAYRCLRPGGAFVSDEDPNRCFWRLMAEIKDVPGMADWVQREVQSVVCVADQLARKTGLSPQQIAMAEFQKISRGGFDADELIALMADVGFVDIMCQYRWFLGQGKILHEQSERDADMIAKFLLEGLPATRCLFKYLSFTARKGK